jgi:hypothetical protein
VAEDVGRDGTGRSQYVLTRHATRYHYSEILDIYSAETFYIVYHL